MCAEEVMADLESTKIQPKAEEELAEPEVPETEVTADVEASEEIVAAEVEAEEDVVAEEPEPEEEVVVEAEAEAVEAVDEPTPEAEAEAGAEAASVVEDEAEDAVALEEPQVPETETEAETEVDDEAEPVEIEVPDDGRAWYVIHCYSGYEAKVRHNLEQRIETMQMQDQIFQVVVPTEDEIEVRDGKRRVVERRVFPGYILVQMLLNDDSWYVVRNTPGVTGFVGMGNEPTPLRSEEVQSIMKRMEAEAPKIKVTFRPGQKVRIIDGPFNEFIGMVDEIDMERAKVRVLVSFFGRETPVELDFLQVEKT
jgi:transcriptional antiterminator NusG